MNDEDETEATSAMPALIEQALGASALRELYHVLEEIECFKDTAAYESFEDSHLHSLPTFGGPDANNNGITYSWDETHVLIFGGRWHIMPRPAPVPALDDEPEAVMNPIT